MYCIVGNFSEGKILGKGEIYFQNVNKIFLSLCSGTSIVLFLKYVSLDRVHENFVPKFSEILTIVATVINSTI